MKFNQYVETSTQNDLLIEFISLLSFGLDCDDLVIQEFNTFPAIPAAAQLPKLRRQAGMPISPNPTGIGFKSANPNAPAPNLVNPNSKYTDQRDQIDKPTQIQIVQGANAIKEILNKYFPNQKDKAAMLHRIIEKILKIHGQTNFANTNQRYKIAFPNYREEIEAIASFLKEVFNDQQMQWQKQKETDNNRLRYVVDGLGKIAGEYKDPNILKTIIKYLMQQVLSSNGQSPTFKYAAPPPLR